MNKKSISCFGKYDKPLTEYHSLNAAREGANYVNVQYSRNLVPYQCKKCNFWHLSPKDRQTPCRTCYCCTDSRGNYKALYDSKKDADRRAGILYKEQGVQLKVYSCLYNNGWHLTKNKT